MSLNLSLTSGVSLQIQSAARLRRCAGSCHGRKFPIWHIIAHCSTDRDGTDHYYIHELSSSKDSIKTMYGSVGKIRK